MANQPPRRTPPKGGHPQNGSNRSSNGQRRSSSAQNNGRPSGSRSGSTQGRSGSGQGRGPAPQSRNGQARRPAPAQTAPKRPTDKKNPAKKKRKKRITIFVVEMVVLGILLLLLFGYTKIGFGRITHEGIKIGDLDINELDSETKELLNGYTTIALFGIDNHDAGNFSNGRTDTIIIACINNDTKEVRLCSVYRDTYLNIGDGVYTKCNAAYQEGGPQQAISMLDNNLDLDITDYITVDFNAMVDIIDLLNGITLTITQEELEAMCGTHRVGTDEAGNPIYEQSENYLETVAEAAGQKPDYNLVAGTQNCSGVTAVAYCRVRYTSGDDYRRSERQREVISQIIAKAKEADADTIVKIINTVFGEIATSYSNMQLLTMASQFASYELVDSAGFPFYKNTKSVGKSGSCVIPCDLVDNVKHLHEFLYQDTSYTPTDTVESISKEITNKTGYTRDDADDRLYGSVVPGADAAAVPEDAGAEAVPAAE